MLRFIFSMMTLLAFSSSLGAVQVMVTFLSSGEDIQLETDGLQTWGQLRDRLENIKGRLEHRRIKYNNRIQNPLDQFLLNDENGVHRIFIEEPLYIQLHTQGPNEQALTSKIYVERHLDTWGDFQSTYVGKKKGDKLIHSGKVKEEHDPWTFSHHQSGAAVILLRSVDDANKLPKAADLFAKAHYFENAAQIKLAMEQANWAQAKSLFDTLSQEHREDELFQSLLAQINENNKE